MKTRTKGLIILLILSSNIMFGSSGGYIEFYKTYKSHKDIITLDIPTFLARFYPYEENKKEIRTLLKKTDDFKIFIAEEAGYQLLAILKESLRNASYNDAMIVSEGDEIITFKIKQYDELVTEIILIVDQIDSFVAISIKGKFTQEDVGKYIRALDAKKAISVD